MDKTDSEALAAIEGLSLGCTKYNCSECYKMYNSCPAIIGRDLFDIPKSLSYFKSDEECVDFYSWLYIIISTSHIEYCETKLCSSCKWNTKRGDRIGYCFRVLARNRFKIEVDSFKYI